MLKTCCGTLAAGETCNVLYTYMFLRCEYCSNTSISPQGTNNTMQFLVGMIVGMIAFLSRRRSNDQDLETTVCARVCDDYYARLLAGSNLHRCETSGLGTMMGKSMCFGVAMLSGGSILLCYGRDCRISGA
eukprot:gnl/TRDRNA2_/TRDRNA2_62891_c0_seq1.p1 gnl/TRDRNA2_/TRDRNA2_62891_c0~~gnl/TRDRNA2_/TRDRNA2_62891_c0_seq1.p1  ORF type:complete len:131 (+),score=5.64 gnl/TRDRNA2_/TRDRNA2_62891_c0_seq1:235-627(+)